MNNHNHFTPLWNIIFFLKFLIFSWLTFKSFVYYCTQGTASIVQRYLYHTYIHFKTYSNCLSSSKAMFPINFVFIWLSLKSFQRPWQKTALTTWCYIKLHSINDTVKSVSFFYPKKITEKDFQNLNHMHINGFPWILGCVVHEFESPNKQCQKNLIRWKTYKITENIFNSAWSPRIAFCICWNHMQNLMFTLMREYISTYFYTVMVKWRLILTWYYIDGDNFRLHIFLRQEKTD